MPEKEALPPVYQACETNLVRYKYGKRSVLSQLVATLIQNWLLINLGMMLTMPTIVLGRLRDNPAEELNLNDDQASWFGSILFFTHPLGSVISGFLQEQFGRKGSMILVNIPLFASWATLYFANSVYHLYIVSLTMGLGIGFCEAPLHSYIGEVGEPHLRGTLSTFSSSAAILGGFLMNVLGYFFHWRTVALISSFVPVITFVCMTQIPESPTWLIMKYRLEDAQKSLSWLRGWTDPKDVHEEFQELLSYTKSTHEANKSDIPGREKYEMVPANENGRPFVETQESYLRTKFKELTDKKLLLPLRLVFIVFVFVNTTVLMGMRPYIVGVFKKLQFPVDSMLILIVTGLFFFLGAMLNLLVLRRFGKRKLVLVSQAIATGSILLMGVYCSLFDTLRRIQILTWIPVILLSSVSFFGGFSLALLPWQLISEVFPIKGRGAAGGISAAWAYYVSFVYTKSYLYLERWIELSGVLYLYGVISAVGFWYYLRYLPETEGKSLEKIESYFTRDHDKKEKFSKPKKSKK